MIGVSPAYFLSHYGPGFGPAELVSGLPFLARTGYEGFQAEVFLESALPLWTESAAKAVVDSAQANGLQCTAFVAHFLGGVFSSGPTLSKGLILDQVKSAITVAASVTSSTTAPILAMRNNRLKGSIGKDRFFILPLLAFESLHTPETGSRFRDLIGRLITLCESSDLRLALELVPGNILGGPAEFLSLVAEPGFEDLGLLFDTGHLWAMGEKVQDLPRTLGHRIVATHLCDNDGIENLSLCPGDGTIPFQATLKALGEAGYLGSLDLEIVCPPAQVEAGYRRAFTQFRQLADQALALTDTTIHPEHCHATGPHTDQQPYKETI